MNEKDLIEKIKWSIHVNHISKELNGNNAWIDVNVLEVVLNLIEKQNLEIKDLKASHIMTHNKVSNEEKAILFDTINNTIDTYLENTKPYWEQIMVKDKMTIEEAETIIDDMYQDRNKILRKAGETETEVIFDVAKLDEVQFTNLEFASIRVLREIQGLRRKIEKQNLEITSLQMEHNHDLKMIDEVKGEVVKLYKMIDLMAEQLTTPIHSKEWVIDFYKREIEKC